MTWFVNSTERNSRRASMSCRCDSKRVHESGIQSPDLYSASYEARRHTDEQLAFQHCACPAVHKCSNSILSAGLLIVCQQLCHIGDLGESGVIMLMAAVASPPAWSKIKHAWSSNWEIVIIVHENIEICQSLCVWTDEQRLLILSKAKETHFEAFIFCYTCP